MIAVTRLLTGVLLRRPWKQLCSKLSQQLSKCKKVPATRTVQGSTARGWWRKAADLDQMSDSSRRSLQGSCRPSSTWLTCMRSGENKAFMPIYKLRSSDKLFRYGDFFSENIIVGPQEAQDSRFWLPWTLTHYILGSICFRTPPPPLYGLKRKNVLF